MDWVNLMRSDKAVYIVLTDTGTWLSRAIGWYTGETLNHASLAFDKELNEVYSFGRKVPDNPFIGGFVREDFNNDWFLKGRGAHCAIYRCPVSDSAYTQIRKYIAALEAKEHQFTYNFIGLFGVAANVRIHRSHAFFCSQFVATALKAGGVQLCDKPPCLTTPRDLAISDKLECVYEGSLLEYKRGRSKEAVRILDRPLYKMDSDNNFAYNRMESIS